MRPFRRGRISVPPFDVYGLHEPTVRLYRNHGPKDLEKSFREIMDITRTHTVSWWILDQDEVYDGNTEYLEQVYFEKTACLWHRVFNKAICGGRFLLLYPFKLPFSHQYPITLHSCPPKLVRSAALRYPAFLGAALRCLTM